LSTWKVTPVQHLRLAEGHLQVLHVQHALTLSSLTVGALLRVGVAAEVGPHDAGVAHHGLGLAVAMTLPWSIAMTRSTSASSEPILCSDDDQGDAVGLELADGLDSTPISWSTGRRTARRAAAAPGRWPARAPSPAA
jgi:hypothetical protein